MTEKGLEKAFEWQVGIWDGMANVYQKEIDKRFAPVVDHLLIQADLQPGQTVMDLGSGTGAAAFVAAPRVGASGRVTAVDISDEMLTMARAGARARALTNIDFKEGRGEAIPCPDQSHDTILASLSLMYVIDREAAAREIARVLRPGGRLVAAVWAGPEQTDIVRFQQTAGSFAPKPPAEGVGPGALADPKPFIRQLSEAGLKGHVETVDTRFQFSDFAEAWNALAAVTTAALEPEVQDEARSAVRDLMWSDGDGPREFRNATHYIVASRSG